MTKLYVIIDFSNYNTYQFYKNILNDFIKELGSINIVDVSKYLKLTATVTKDTLDENYILYTPEKLSDFKKIFSNKECIFLYCINSSKKYFLLNFLLARFKAKKFIISNIGYNPENFNYKNQNFFQKINIFFRIRVSYFIFRILTILNIMPNIDYFFESSSYIINSINNGWSKKISKLFPSINLSYYKKVIKINNRDFDSYLNKRFKISEEYIVFIDGMIFDHMDRIYREGKPSNIQREKYYKNLNEILMHLQKIFKKEVIICLHPKNDFSIPNNDFKQFKCDKFKTEEYISNSFIVLFHESSSIIQAILLKKKIINLQGKTLGNYVNSRCNLYANPLGLKKIDIDKYIIEDNNLILKELNKSILNYDDYIKKNIINDKSKTGIKQIIDYLEL